MLVVFVVVVVVFHGKKKKGEGGGSVSEWLEPCNSEAPSSSRVLTAG